MMEYEIIDHGYCHSQYFQGCGVSHTIYDHCFTGAGNSAKEAYEDAVDLAYQGDSVKRETLDKLPRRPRGIRLRPCVPRDYEDTYWYVSIRIKE